MKSRPIWRELAIGLYEFNEALAIALWLIVWRLILGKEKYAANVDACGAFPQKSLQIDR